MNKNPYEVLGIPTNASDDEVKRAYRDLTRKYHPDANVNNPLADLAEEKFKEVQEAYDMIIDESPDIVLTDIKMPVMDGIELIKKTREFDRQVTFIILSGYGEFELAKRASEGRGGAGIPVEALQLRGRLLRLC